MQSQVKAVNRKYRDFSSFPGPGDKKTPIHILNSGERCSANLLVFPLRIDRMRAGFTSFVPGYERLAELRR
jgi:hypothetical protein